MFNKIDQIIKERGLKASECAYHTLRSLDNDGKIRVLAIKGEENATAEYICPFCGKHGSAEELWKRPFSIKCCGCDKTMKVPKLKGKKDKKKKKAAVKKKTTIKKK